MSPCKSRRPGAVLLVALGLVALALAAACGDDDDENGDGHTATGDIAARAGDIEIIDPYARQTVNDVAAVYLTLQSVGLEDTLVAAEANVGSAWQIHEVVTQGGTSSMQQVEGGLVVPAGDHVHLEPGGYHLMLMGLTEPLEPGDAIRLDLTFASGATASFEVPVRALGDEGGEDHDSHE